MWAVLLNVSFTWASAPVVDLCEYWRGSCCAGMPKRNSGAACYFTPEVVHVYPCPCIPLPNRGVFWATYHCGVVLFQGALVSCKSLCCCRECQTPAMDMQVDGTQLRTRPRFKASWRPAISGKCFLWCVPRISTQTFSAFREDAILALLAVLESRLSGT
jgi:hypothetical protein